MIIKNTTKLEELLNEYPQLGMTIAAILPDFGSLEQPQLKGTVLSITTIEHLASKTGREVSELISTFNSVIGIQPQNNEEDGKFQYLDGDPNWVQIPPRHIVDGVELLSRGEHPLAAIQAILKDMAEGEWILLKTNFPPEPMIEAMEAAGADIYSRKNQLDSNQFLTFIRR